MLLTRCDLDYLLPGQFFKVDCKGTNVSMARPLTKASVHRVGKEKEGGETEGMKEVTEHGTS